MRGQLKKRDMALEIFLILPTIPERTSDVTIGRQHTDTSYGDNVFPAMSRDIMCCRVEPCWTAMHVRVFVQRTVSQAQYAVNCNIILSMLSNDVNVRNQQVG